MPTNGNCASPICWAIRNTQSTAATPASLRASTSSCNAQSASASVAPISRTAPSPSTASTSTAGSTGCSRRRPPPRPDESSPKASANAVAISSFSSPVAMSPPPNNDCERALRPSVIFRKVTGGFRSKWGAQTYAAAASVIDTGRLHGNSALQALQAALAGRPVLVAPDPG